MAAGSGAALRAAPCGPIQLNPHKHSPKKPSSHLKKYIYNPFLTPRDGFISSEPGRGGPAALPHVTSAPPFCLPHLPALPAAAPAPPGAAPILRGGPHPTSPHPHHRHPSAGEKGEFGALFAQRCGRGSLLHVRSKKRAQGSPPPPHRAHFHADLPKKKKKDTFFIMVVMFFI